MTTSTETQDNGMNQILIWIGVAVVALAVLYFFVM
jgi:hypothetical protein